MTIVNPVGSPSSAPAAYAPQPASGSGQTLTAQDFMQLLVTQLENQDPTQPMDSAAMVQQTTELGMMQEMSSVQANTTSSVTLQAQSIAADLIGRTISYTDAGGTVASGVVSGVSFSGAAPTVTVNGSTLGLSSILGITQSPTY